MRLASGPSSAYPAQRHSLPGYSETFLPFSLLCLCLIFLSAQWRSTPSTSTNNFSNYAWTETSPVSETSTSALVSDTARLAKDYPNAYNDFYGMPSNPPCVYKSGPAWPKPTPGPHPLRQVREARPVYGHPITGTWIEIGTNIYKFLNSSNVNWDSIDPVAFANAGEEPPFCPLLIWIGVVPKTLSYDNAVYAANAIKGILGQASFPEIEVAFRESEVTRSGCGPKLLSFNPLLDPVPEFRKLFTPTLGLGIAPLNTPYYEGTGALYYRLGGEENHVVLLTAAHVARPPPEHKNNSHKRNSQRREEIVALGIGGYQTATNSMMAEIGTLAHSIEAWERRIAKLGVPANDESPMVTRRRRENQNEVEKAKDTINDLNNLHTEVTKFRTNPHQRVIGFVLHAEAIEVSAEPHKHYTRDWALIQIYKDKIDWDTFLGNKVYIGGNLSLFDFGKLLFPHPQDRKDYTNPEEELLQASGIVQEDEIRQPKHLDVHGQKALFVVKNGLATGTTVGRVNGLDSFTRIYDTTHGIEHTSVQTAVLPYDKERGPFSAQGDSGAIILDRAGRIVALLTGGSGANDEIDITYGTPYWWIDEEIKKAFPGCQLYEVVN